MSGALMSNKNLSQTYIAKRVQEILDLSEGKLLQVLQGKTKIPEKMVVQVALEIYKRRIPTKVENEHTGSQLTIVKIVKNHLPDKEGEVIDLPRGNFEKVEEVAEEVVNDRVKKINEKIKKSASSLGRKVQEEDE